MRRLNGRHSWLVLFTAGMVLACAVGAAGQQFQYTTIWVPGATEGTLVLGVNDSQVVVGYYVALSGGGQQGFMKSGQAVTTLDYPGAGGSTICFGINNSGAVVGQYLDLEAHFHAFLYENGTYTTIDPPGASEAGAGGINNLGQIVGTYTDQAGAQHGFILQGNSYQTLDVPGAEYTFWAGGINDSGEVTLQWYDAATKSTQSSVYDGSTYTTIDVGQAAINTFAYAINNKGLIAINWQDDNLITYATVRVQGPRGGYLYPSIEDPNESEFSTYCYGVNNKSEVVGRYTSSKAILGFAAAPVP